MVCGCLCRRYTYTASFSFERFGHWERGKMTLAHESLSRERFGDICSDSQGIATATKLMIPMRTQQLCRADETVVTALPPC